LRSCGCCGCEMVYSRLSLSFHVTFTFQSSVASNFDAKFSFKTRKTFRGEGFLHVGPLFKQRSFLYQCKQIPRCELVASVQNDESTKDEDSSSFHWTRIFIPDSMKIDNKYANVWLAGVPNLGVECSETKTSEFLEENVNIGSKEFSTKNLALTAAAPLLRPKRLAKIFPLKLSSSRFSRVF